MKTIHLDEIDATRIGNSLWKPIRSTLGIRAFGINAYIAERAGDTLFDERDETEIGAGGQRHEETIAEEGLKRYPRDPRLRQLLEG